MRILLTNLNLTHYTGTESTTYALCKELRARGHMVTVWTAKVGKMADKIAGLGVCVVTAPPLGNFDVAFVNHNIFWERVQGLKFYTTHGDSKEEAPPTDTYFSATEFLGANVIRQGIDLNRFKHKPINETLQNILLLSNPNYSQGKAMVKTAFPDHNVITLDEETFDIEKYIYQADLVISFFRGALESLACGRNVIYADWRNGQTTMEGYGIINKETYELFKTGQMRRLKRGLSIQDLQEMVEQYDSKLSLRKEIERDFDIKKTVNLYLQHANKEIYKDTIY